MSDVDRVVHTETDGNHDVVAGYSVDGDTPEVQEASDIDQGEENLRKDNKRLVWPRLVSTKDLLTQKIMMTAPRRLHMKRRVVKNTATTAKAMFL